MAGESYNRYGFWPETARPERIVYRKADAAQTWKRGDMLTLAAGLMQPAVAGSTNLIGPACDDRTSTTSGDLCPVYFEPGCMYLGRVSADASAVLAGAEVDLIGASGAQQVDVAASATDVFIFQALVESETQSAVGALVRVTINDSKQALV